MSIAQNLKSIQDRIAAAAVRAGREPSSVKLVTVTKTVSVERIREAVSAGAEILGENRVQEARDKLAELGNAASWHLIGRLQTNKAKYAVKLFDLIHSVDSRELATELDRQAAKINKVQYILIEVNISGETQKAGVPADAAPDLVRHSAGLPHVRIRGLMTMPPYSENPEDSRPCFKKLRELSSKIANMHIPGVSMAELSMGMSGDFETAVEEGATLVRVGTAIFGERNAGG
jgi:hypothetical protein